MVHEVELLRRESYLYRQRKHRSHVVTMLLCKNIYALALAQKLRTITFLLEVNFFLKVFLFDLNSCGTSAADFSRWEIKMSTYKRHDAKERRELRVR